MASPRAPTWRARQPHVMALRHLQHRLASYCGGCAFACTASWLSRKLACASIAAEAAGVSP
eukprot:10470414-Alexandrium_andersonii.AAC.1